MTKRTKLLAYTSIDKKRRRVAGWIAKILAFVAVVALFQLASAPSVAASFYLVENFDNTTPFPGKYVYQENDTYGNLRGAQADNVCGSSPYSFMLAHEGGHTAAGDNQQVVKNVNLENVENIYYTLWWKNPGGYFGQKFRVYIDDILLYETPEPGVTTTITKIGDFENNITSYGLTGYHDLIFQIAYTIDRDTQDESAFLFIDNIAFDDNTPPPPADIVVDNVRADSVLIDRDVDWSGSGAITGTTIYADVEFPSGTVVVKENVFFAIRDATDAWIDNKQATDNLRLADNKQRFWVDYSALDNTLSDSQLGRWDVQVLVYNNNNQGESSLFSNIFTVDDWTSDNNLENMAGHKIRFYGTVSRVSGLSGTVTGLWLWDNNLGLMLQTTSNTFDNTFSVPCGGYIVPKIKSENLDGYGDNTNYLYPNIPPEIIYFSSSNPLVDRKQDDASQNPTLTTTLTIRVRDNDNNSELTTARILVRDSKNTLQENADVWSTATMYDENTYTFTLSDFDPPNTIPDENLGGWDIGGSATDKYGGSVLAWGSGDFTVDDLRILNLAVTPENSLLGITWGYSITVGGNIQRVAGTVSTDNYLWVSDPYKGKLAVGGDNEVTYIIDNICVSPGDTVTVTFLAKDNVLDGDNTTTYTITDNRVYDWSLKYEENAENYTLIENHVYKFQIYYTDGTGETVNINETRGELVTTKPLYDIAIKVDNTLSNDYDYYRTLTPETPRENLVFYLVGVEHAQEIAEYVFTLEDYTGLYGAEENGQALFQKTPDHLATIIHDRWGIGSRVNVYLWEGTRYQLVLRGKDNNTRVLGYIWASSTYDITITVRPLTPENVEYFWNYVEFSVWRENNSIFVSYDDTKQNTNSVDIDIYDMVGNLKYSTTQYLNSFEIEWTDAENEQSYRVKITIDHADFGTTTENRTIGLNLAAFVIEQPDTINLGNPIPLLSLLALAIGGIAMLSMGGAAASIGIFLLAGLTSIMSFLGWVSDMWPVAVFLWIIGVIHYIGGRR